MFLPTGRIQHKSQRCGPEFIVPAYLLAYFEAFYDKRYRMLANHSIVYVRGQAPQPTEELANIYHGIGGYALLLIILVACVYTGHCSSGCAFGLP